MHLKNQKKTLIDNTRASFLDGMRGWASLMVFGGHLITIFGGYKLSDSQLWLLRFPCDGTAAVYIFFVVSGFALSTQFIKEKKISILTSLALRRYIRLVIPILSSVLCAYVLMDFGLMFSVKAGILMNNEYLRSFYNFIPSFYGAIYYAVYGVFFHYSDVWPSSYNRVLWTMSWELIGSGLVLGLLALIGYLKNRFVIYLFLVLLFSLIRMPVLIAFVLGILLAEFYNNKAFNKICTMYGAECTIFGVLLLSIGWIYSTLMRDYDQYRFELPFIAFGMVLGVMISSKITSLFESCISTFLGKISFPLYLIHFLVMSSLTSYSYIRLVGIGFNHREAIVIPLILSFPITILLARFCLPIEEFAISTSRYFAKKIMSPQSLCCYNKH